MTLNLEASRLQAQDTIERHSDTGWSHKGRCAVCITRLPCDQRDLAEQLLEALDNLKDAQEEIARHHQDFARWEEISALRLQELQ